MIATAICHDGRNSYQINYGNTISSAKNSFQEDMRRRSCRWGKLILIESGEMIDTYPLKEAEQEVQADEKKLVIKVGNNESSTLPNLQKIVFSDPMDALQASHVLLAKSRDVLEGKSNKDIVLETSGCSCILK